MTTIWKFPIEKGQFELSLSADAQVVHVGMQGEEAFVWIEHDPDAHRAPFEFKVFGTGWEIPEEWANRMTCRHGGTWQDGQFVWHLYWRPRP